MTSAVARDTSSVRVQRTYGLSRRVRESAMPHVLRSEFSWLMSLERRSLGLLTLILVGVSFPAASRPARASRLDSAHLSLFR